MTVQLQDLIRDMLLLVHTVSLAHDNFVVNARFYHALCSDGPGQRLRLALLGRRVAVTLRRTRRGVDRRMVYYFKQRRSRSNTTVVPSRGSVPPAVGLPKAERSPPPTPNLPVSVTNTTQPEQAPLQDLPVYLQPLCSDASAQQTAQWLTTQRFSAYLRTFASFSGADILRLSRDDLIQICGLPDGIRLFNALHSKSIAPRLTVYLSLEDSPVFHALFLEGLTCAELGAKLATLLGLSATQVQRVYLQGPAGIHVVLSDEVVRNLKDQAMFTIQLIHEPSSEHYRLLLKPASR